VPTPATYVTVEESLEYFKYSLKFSTWDASSDDDKLRAIVDATRRIDRLNFHGIPTADWLNKKQGPLAQPISQPLEFPRNGSEITPQDIKDACCEIAFSLLDGVDPEQDLRGVSITSHGLSSARIAIDTAESRMAIRHGIPSETAWLLLVPFLLDASEFKISRV
jgi:hypothetical protein